MYSESTLSLAETFQTYFRVQLADNEELKQEVYRVRYRVYCEEFGYEPVNNFPDHLEKDEFDDSSTHCLIVHRESGISASCVRMVPATGPRETSPLPFEKVCGDSLDATFFDNFQVDRSSVCEMSRLAVDSRFRRRPGEFRTPYGEVHSLNLSLEEQRLFPLIAVAGFLTATVLTKKANRTNVFALMEPFLPRLTSRSGIVFQRVGGDVEYRGVRAPYYVTPDSVLENMHEDLRSLYEWISQSINIE